MPEDLLHAPQVRAPLQQVGRHRVPKSVRAEVRGPLCQLEGTMNHPAHHAWIDPLATFTEEHGLSRFRRRQVQPCLCEPRLEGTQGRHAQWDCSLLAAFAENSDHSTLSIKISQVEAAQLRYPDSSGVQDLQDGHVASGNRSPNVPSRRYRPIEHLSCRCGLQSGGQYATDLGRAEVRRWIWSQMTRILRPGEE